MHENSLQANHEEKRKLSARSRAIRSFCLKQKAPMTDRQVMTGMGFNDMNCVRPRINELIEAGLALEVGSTKCNTTKKTVRLTQMVKDEDLDKHKQMSLLL